ncbi:hypothetical protein ACI797_03140 [Geodermatophilus sp. SYSU D00691]
MDTTIPTDADPQRHERDGDGDGHLRWPAHRPGVLGGDGRRSRATTGCPAAGAAGDRRARWGP